MKGETSLAYVPIHPRCPNPSRLWVFRLFLNDVNGNGKLIANMWFVDSLPKKVLNSHEILDSMITISCDIALPLAINDSNVVLTEEKEVKEEKQKEKEK